MPTPSINTCKSWLEQAGFIVLHGNSVEDSFRDFVDKWGEDRVLSVVLNWLRAKLTEHKIVARMSDDCTFLETDFKYPDWDLIPIVFADGVFSDMGESHSYANEGNYPAELVDKWGQHIAQKLGVGFDGYFYVKGLSKIPDLLTACILMSYLPEFYKVLKEGGGTH